MRAMDRAELVFGIGPAGTGKTYLAVAHAAALLERGDINRIILSRPAVEAGERLGFLPGDMKEKVDPYLRPLYDALYDMMPPEHVERCITSGMIEVAPLAFMRGRTLANAVVILDEAQNTTSMQMKMFLTRLGENSKMIVTGDPTQIDLPPRREVRPGRGDRACSTASRASHISASPTRTWCATRSSAASCAPTKRDGRKRGRRGHARAARRPEDPARDRRDRRDGRLAATASSSRSPRRPIRAALAPVRRAGAGGAGSRRIVLTDDAEQRELNRDWRGNDKPTNVLTFPADRAVRAGLRAARRHHPCPRNAGARSGEQGVTLDRPLHPSRGPWLSAPPGL